jgi:hypothetical protein
VGRRAQCRGVGRDQASSYGLSVLALAVP